MQRKRAEEIADRQGNTRYCPTCIHFWVTDKTDTLHVGTVAGPRYLQVSGDEDGLRRDLAAVINRYCRENGSNTPDWILADYLVGCLNAFDAATRARTDYNQPGTPT